MKKVFVLMFIFFGLVGFAQELKHCGTDEVYRKRIQDHPEIIQEQRKLDSFTQSFIKSSFKTEGKIYVIPIVFHIIHNYGDENITDEQVLDAVKIINQDFRKQNTDITNVIPAFQGITADCEIEFRLARKDPNGNCTNGIDRIVSTLTNNADDGSKLNQWDAKKYLNIWVVNSIGTSGVAGYAYYPSAVSRDNTGDGIIILSNYIGSIGTGNVNTSRALTHEIGHYLNLQHLWGNTNNPGEVCGDDDVSDTPGTKGWTSCNLSGAICNSSIIENVQNFMEYSYCSNMYTQGQKSRMQAALNASTAFRNNLWSSSNLSATGTDGSIINACAPKADFVANFSTACAGVNVTYTDLSYNGRPTSWQWSFAGGIPAISNDSVPTVQYNTPGVYSVTLTCANPSGAGTITKNSFINVLSPTATYSGVEYSESFESGTFPNNDWRINNADGIVTWQKTTSASSNGLSSIFINNISNTIDQVDEAISPTIDISKITSPANLNFKIAYAKSSLKTNDKLEVYISKDCGVTWTLFYNKFGTALSTGPITNSSFVPNSSQWRQESISLATVQAETSVLIKFKFTSKGGNNVYVDDINILGPLGVNEAMNDFKFNVYPNPIEESSVVAFHLSEKQFVNLTLCDVLGNQVATFVNESMNGGDYQFNINKSGSIASGIYFVKMTTNKIQLTQKVLVN